MKRKSDGGKDRRVKGRCELITGTDGGTGTITHTLEVLVLLGLSHKNPEIKLVLFLFRDERKYLICNSGSLHTHTRCVFACVCVFSLNILTTKIVSLY